MADKVYLWSRPIEAGSFFRISSKTKKEIVEKYPWTERLFIIPYHTFVTIGKEWFTAPEDHTMKGYWYCAGEFTPTNDSTLEEFEAPFIDTQIACCLVKPNIKKDDPAHEYDVIGGSYIVDYVCHNIANRILYAAQEPITIIDTSIRVTGYKAIINSPLGIYGRIKREWKLICEKCLKASGGSVSGNGDSFRKRDEEIKRIHQKAADGNTYLGDNITRVLSEIDRRYSDESDKIFNDFDNGLIDIETLNERMIKNLRLTILETERTVGDDMTKKIYGDYDIGIDLDHGPSKPEPSPAAPPKEEPPPPTAPACI